MRPFGRGHLRSLDPDNVEKLRAKGNILPSLCLTSPHPHPHSTHCPQSRGSLVEAQIPTRKRVISITSGLGLGAEGRDSLCADSWSFALTSLAFRFPCLLLKHFPSIFSLHTLISICFCHFTNERTEAKSPQGEFVPSCRPKYSP